MMRTLWMDLRHAARALRRRPAYLAVCVVTLALGIGANAAMFAVVNTVVLRPLAYPDADELVMVFHTLPSLGWEMGPMAYPSFLALEAGATTVRGVAAQTGREAVLLDRGDPRRVSGRRVTGGTFPLLGVEPALGRYILPADDRPDAERVVVLSHGLWTDAFGADPSVVGRTVRFSDGPYTVVGVMPRDFPSLGEGDEHWVPLALNPAQADSDTNFLVTLARLGPGADVDALRAEADALLDGIAVDDEARARDAYVTTRHEYVVGGVRHQLVLLLASVGLVLLVACANVAGLTLTRATGRRRELAVRSALGAGRGRLVRHLMAESALLAAVGGILGSALALGLTEAMVRWGPADLPRKDALALDGTTLLFLVAATALCALLFGAAPALRAAAAGPAEDLKDGGRSASGGLRAQAVLAGAQVALATVLLVGGALLGASLARLQSVDPGFETDGALTASVVLPGDTPDERNAFVAALEERLAADGRVDGVGMSWGIPFAARQASTRAMREDQTLDPDDRTRLYITPVTSGFFQAMGMRLLAGSGIPDDLSRTDPDVAVVNEALVRALWPGQDPIGLRFLRGGDDDARPTTVVGVVADVHTSSLDAEPVPYAYLPMVQASWADAIYVVLRTSADPLDLVPHLRASVAALDDEVPVDQIATLGGRMSATLARPRFRTALAVGFAFVGGLLAVVGVYGLMGLLVAGRTREIGVRMALGAGRSRVRRTVVAQGLGVAAAGLVAGLAAAALLVRVVESYLFGVSATDPWTWTGVAVAVMVAAFLAVAPPARRASSVDPLVALRAE